LNATLIRGRWLFGRLLPTELLMVLMFHAS
jgi:hypothetical protein